MRKVQMDGSSLFQKSLLQQRQLAPKVFVLLHRRLRLRNSK